MLGKLFKKLIKTENRKALKKIHNIAKYAMNVRLFDL